MNDEALPFRTRYTAKRFRTFPEGADMTKQSFKDQCDINRIMGQYKRTGVISHLKTPGQYQDLPAAFDYHQAMNVVARSREAFQSMPSQLRDRFHNRPDELLGFLEDTGNRDEAIKLGLIPQPKPQEAAPEGSPPPKAPKVARDAPKP